MKNLANCKPSEFLQQTNRIRKSVSKWLTDTDISNIRKKMPDIPKDATDEQRQELAFEQAKKNTAEMLDAILDEHPEETLEVLALCCFVEPEDVDNYTMDEYFASLAEVLNNRAAFNFFMSLTRWASQLT